ncbi:hypothetical protein ACVWYH_010321 [Bradyrhizobium sp. GM24.11]
MRSMSRVIVLGIALAVCGGAPVSSATIKRHAGKNGGVIITLSGPITFGDSDTFTREVQQANAAGKVVEIVQLDSGGGRLVEGVKLATAIKNAGISTSVGSGDVCASACFLIFAAGATKFLGDGARVGVHKASDKDGRETTSSGAATESMAHFAKELGVPASIIARMVRTPSKQIVWLDSQDLKAMGVSLAGVPVQTRRIASSGPLIQQASTSLSAWNDFVDNAAKLSADQNGGEPALSRQCQPELNNCVLGLDYRLKDGRKGLAVVIQDLGGKTLRREACEFNRSNDIMECVDWESGSKHRDAKNEKGDWVQAPDQ